MFSKLIQFGQIGKDTLINVVGTFLIGVIGLIFYIFVARNLGPSEFGLFSVAVGVLVVTADIFDFGTNTGIVKFMAEAAGRKNFEKAAKIANFAFWFKLTIGALIIMAGFWVSQPLAILGFGQPGLSKILPAAFAGVLVILLLGFFTSIFQAFAKFFEAVVINLGANLVRLIIIIILAIFEKLSVQTATIVFSASPIFGILIGWINSPLKFFQKTFDKELALKFLSFNKWVALGFIFAAIQVRLPNFLLVRLSNAAETGLFSAAQTIILFAPQITSALSVTFAPKFSQIKNINQLKQLFNNTVIITSTLAFLTLSLIPFASFILNITVGGEYAEATKSFQILVISAFFLIASVPQSAAIIYFWSKPEIYTYLSVIQLGIIFILNFFLIPDMGAEGAAISSLVATGTGFLVSSLYVFLRWQKP